MSSRATKSTSDADLEGDSGKFDLFLEMLSKSLAYSPTKIEEIKAKFHGKGIFTLSDLQSSSEETIEQLELVDDVFEQNLLAYISSRRLRQQFILVIHLAGAKKIPTKDLFSKSDTFIKFLLDSNEVKSSIIKNTSNPKWGETLELPVKYSDLADLKKKQLRMRVFDHDPLSRDDFIAEASFSFEDMIPKDASFSPTFSCHFDSAQLLKGKGSVELTISLKTVAKREREKVNAALKELQQHHDNSSPLTQKEFLETVGHIVKNSDKFPEVVRKVENMFKLPVENLAEWQWPVGRKRIQWTNYSDEGRESIENHPLKIYWPEDIGQIVKVIRKAEQNGLKVRAMGSHHSMNDILNISDFLIETRNNLSKVLNGLDGKPKVPFLKDDEKVTKIENYLVKVECGITVSNLNKTLERNKKSIINMGGAGVQTIIGAISTSTHGSGISLPPLPDFVRSIHLVSTGGQQYVIEPSDGITDRKRFEAEEKNSHIKLIQKDDFFYSVVVGLGSFGVVYSLTMEVTDLYYLAETRTKKTVDEVKELLREKKNPLFDKYRHVEVLVSPYPSSAGKDIHSLLTLRKRVDDNLVQEGSRGIDLSFLETEFTSDLLVSLTNKFPKFLPFFLEKFGVDNLESGHFQDVNWRIFTQGNPDRPGTAPGMASEVAVPFQVWTEALDALLELYNRFATKYGRYMNLPIAIRFVRQSDHYLSMTYSDNKEDRFVFFELLFLRGCHGCLELIEAAENLMLSFGGRPHWGMFNHLTPDLVDDQKMYPKWNQVKAVFKELNGEQQTFSNQFTERMNLSRKRYNGQQ